MKHTTILMLTILAFMVGCSDKTTTKSSSSAVDPLICQQYPYATGCSGTVGGVAGGTICTQNPYNYGCPQYCVANPTAPVCAGTTTGGTTGGVNPYPQVIATPTGSWTGQYPGGEPTGVCSTPYAPAGISNPYDVRRASLMIVGGQWYNPSSPDAASLMNTSSILKSVVQAKTFFSTDSMLKVRFKVKPQPTATSKACYGIGSASTIAGYTKLQFSARLFGQRADGSVTDEPLGSFTVGVNSCSPGVDLSNYQAIYPNGVYLVIESVQGNQLSFPPDYATNGFTNMNGFKTIRTSDCWSMDLEVAADGTKIFD